MKPHNLVTGRKLKPLRVRVLCNAWGNWYGYVGNRRVAMFCNGPEGTAEQEARTWFDTMISKTDEYVAGRNPWGLPEGVQPVKVQGYN